MITAISPLETNVLKAVFDLAQKNKNVNFPKELLVEKEVLKKNQVNALLNNLRAKGIIEVNVDLFGFTMVSMSYDGVKFCKTMSRKKTKAQIH